MASKFKIGDKVMVNFHKGKIVNIRHYSLPIKYTVKFDDPNLIPSEMDFEESNISFNQTDSVCPICKTKWKIVKFNMKTWKDCAKCNKTSEAIMEEIETKKNFPPPIPNEARTKDQLVKEFELMIDGLDTDFDLDDIGNWPGDYNFGYDDDEDVF